VDERILSLVKSLSIVGEMEPEKAPINYDFKALKRIFKSKPDKAVYVRLFNVPDRVEFSEQALNKLYELADEVKFEVIKVAKTYAYKIVSPYIPPFSRLPHIAIFYASSHGVFDRFESLVNEYEHFVQSLSHMMWESLQYVEYLCDYEWYEKPRQIVLDFYKKYSNYLDIMVEAHSRNYYVTVFCPAMLKGLLIGRKGSTVKSLIEELKNKLGCEVEVHIKESEFLTEKYRRDHPELNLPPKALQLLSEIIPQLKTLREQYGVKLQEIDVIIDILEQKGEDE